MSNLKESIKVGIIGLGRSGRDIHCNTLLKDSKYKIIGVVDSIDERLAKAKEDLKCSVYKDYKELLVDKEIELIVVATPSHTHCRIAIDALDAGKNVLVEKPMAISVKEVDEMINASEKNEKILTVFQNRRFYPDFLKIQEIISSGILGQIYFIRRGVYGFGRRTDWQTLKKYGGGMLNNWGSHLIDQILVLLDYNVKEIFSDIKHTVSAGDAEDHVKIVIKGEKFVGDIEITSCCVYPQMNWLIIGKYGTLIVEDDVKIRYKYYDPESLRPLPEIEEIPQFSDLSYPREEILWKEEVIDTKRNSQNCETEFYNVLYETIRNNKPLVVRPEQVRMVLEIIEKCQNIR